jgi:hypothetical protein
MVLFVLREGMLVIYAKKNISLNDKLFFVRYLEKKFLARSASAFADARRKSLSAGLSVVVSEKGVIYELAPDGGKKILKEIAPPASDRPGRKIYIH